MKKALVRQRSSSVFCDEDNQTSRQCFDLTLTFKFSAVVAISGNVEDRFSNFLQASLPTNDMMGKKNPSKSVLSNES